MKLAALIVDDEMLGCQIVMFLDIQLPEINGFELLEMLPKNRW